jgi:hypothetical protein
MRRSLVAVVLRAVRLLVVLRPVVLQEEVKVVAE